MPPNLRSAGFTYRFDPGTVPSLESRLYPAFRKNLIVTLKEVVDSIIQASDEMLKVLPPDHIPYDNIMGGRDTSTMANSLAGVLLSMVEDGVAYQLKSTEAYYWEFIEFGHFVHTAEGPKWWEGYHFFEIAIKAHEKAIMGAARLAWNLAVLETRGTAMVPLGITEGALAALSAK